MKSTGPRVLSASEVPYNLAPISQSWGKEKPYLSQLHVRAAVEPRATDAWASLKGLAWEAPTWKEPSCLLTGGMTCGMSAGSALQVSL